MRQPKCNGTGGSGSIPARSAPSRSTGAAPTVLTLRLFAFANQPVSWSLKSCGEVNDLPGMNEVSNQPFLRFTMPLDSGSFGGSSTSRVASVPMNAATPSARLAPRPMPGSLSQSNRRGTAPRWPSSSHVPSSRSSVLRVGIILASMKRECAAVITSTGSNRAVPSSSGIFRGGNHKSHCATSPGSQTRRSAGSTRRCSGRSRFTFCRNHVIDPVQPTRSAITVAGMSGSASSRARTRASNTTNDDSVGERS